MDNRPKGREKHVTGQGKDIYKRGEGLGSGPVGSTGGRSGQNTQGAGGILRILPGAPAGAAHRAAAQAIAPLINVLSLTGDMLFPALRSVVHR